MSPQVQIKPWLHCRPLSAVFCCLYSALGPPLAGARCHRSHFGSRYRSGLGFPAGLFLSICCCFLLSCSAHLLLELDVTAGTDQALAPLPAWAHLLLELDVTVAILAQGADQALASEPASFCQLLLLLVVLLLAAHTSCWSQMSPQVQIKPWLHCRPLSAVFCCLYSALGPPLAGARCHRSHFGSRYRSGLGFPAGLFLSIAAASCCLAPCSAHLLLELDVTAGTDQALAPLPASFCCFLLSLQRTGPTSCWS